MRYLSLILAISIVTLAGCNQYARLLKKGTVEEKYAAAVKYYNKKDYVRATPLLEELLGNFKMKKEAPEIYMMYSYSHFYQREYTLAGYHFKNFVETYIYSPRKEEAAFMYSSCEFNKSMPYDLDQSNTKSAISTIQVFINQYPESKYMDNCNLMMDRLRGRLHKKAYETALLYYHIEDYKAAMVALTVAVSDFPDIPWKDEMTFLTFKSAYLYAKKSVTSVQKERYLNAEMFYKEYMDEFGRGGAYIEDAEKYYKKLLSEKSEVESKLIAIKQEAAKNNENK
jgi:outer membrane protein assembly factor BamD